MSKLIWNSNWLIKVPAYQGEIFSSWLVRVAMVYGCDPLDITSNLWDEWRAWTVDIDRSLNDDKLQAIIDTGIIEPCELNELFLHPLASKIGLTDTKSIWPWVLTIGSRNRKRLGGIQFCPECLGDTPFYKVHWRFAWHTCCQAHKKRLHQKCPECKSAIEYHRIDALDKHIYLCASCKYDLRCSSGVSVDQAEIDRQIVCDKVLAKGYGYFGSVKLLSKQWFFTYTFFIRFLQKCTDVRLLGLRQVLFNLGIDPDEIYPSSTGLILEMIDVDERALMLNQSFPLMSSGPRAIKRQILDGVIRVNALLSIMNPLPDKIRSMFKVNIPKFTNDKGSTEKYLPKSKQSVLKALQRFNRGIRKSD